MKVHVRNDNKVVIDEMPQSRQFVLDADDAVRFAMAVAEAAAKCGYANSAGTVLAHVESKMHAQVTDALHALMVTRAAKVIPQLLEHKLTPADAARQIVDIVLNAAQGRVVH